MTYWNGTAWVAEETAAPAKSRRLARRLLGATIEAGLITALIFGLIASSAFAAKGGGHTGGGGGGGRHGGGSGGSGTITMQMVDPADTTANWGDWVTFTVSTTSTDQPWVHLVCKVGGTVVAEGWNGYFDGSLTGRNFGLYSPQWTSGGADCTGYLTNPQWSVLGSTAFTVYP